MFDSLEGLEWLDNEDGVRMDFFCEPTTPLPIPDTPKELILRLAETMDLNARYGLARDILDGAPTLPKDILAQVKTMNHAKRFELVWAILGERAL